MTSSSMTITFSTSSDGGNTVPKNVTLIVKDYLTDQPIAAAAVTLTGPGYSFSGVSGDDGSIYVGTLQPGDYTLVTSATGYIPSDKDALANDSFTI